MTITNLQLQHPAHPATSMHIHLEHVTHQANPHSQKPSNHYPTARADNAHYVK
ncbi:MULTISPECIES: hypothetical protein [Frankia]|uniref:hypothetical protein n=1 Tax=Frankia TaxID=1854 RepID=UPI000A9B5C6F|nr:MULTISPECIES: hypothetical protein [Frankia]